MSLASVPSGSGQDPPTLKQMMAALTPGQRKIIQSVVAQIQRDLIESLPEIQAAVKTAAGQGSFSVTLDVKASKQGRFKGLLRPRVRAPREATEFDFHIDDSGQLSLGLPLGWDAGGAGGGGDGDGDGGDGGSGGEM